MVALLLIPIALLFAVLNGATLNVFWDWFIAGPNAPFYGHVPQISFIQALGLSLVISFLTFQPGAEKNNEDKSAAELLIETTAVGLVYFGTVWVFALIYHGLA